MLKIKGKINYFFILFWILLVASINNPLGYYNANNIVDILRFIISLSPIFVLIISAILYIINFKSYEFYI